MANVTNTTIINATATTIRTILNATSSFNYTTPQSSSPTLVNITKSSSLVNTTQTSATLLNLTQVSTAFINPTQSSTALISSTTQATAKTTAKVLIADVTSNKDLTEDHLIALIIGTVLIFLFLVGVIMTAERCRHKFGFFVKHVGTKK